MNDFKTRFNDILKDYNDPIRKKQEEIFISQLRDKKVILFGAAWIGDFVWEKLESLGIKPVCFCDNYAEGVSPKGHSPIIRPAQLVSDYPDAIVILTMDKGKEAVNSQLIELGLPQSNIIKGNTCLEAVYTYEQLIPHLEGYEWAYNFFEDDISKNIIIQRISCYMLGTSVMRSECPQYFEKGLFGFSDHEVFADGGFFTGDTSTEFIRQVNGKYTAIYGFEPDKYVAEKAATLINNNPKITLVPKGLYNEDKVLKFQSTNGCSQASGGQIVQDQSEDENCVNIPVTSLDRFFSNIDTKPTFIKMDIEGTEYKALLGAKNIITENKPKLAICVYHKPEDIYELPRLINSFRSDYHFTLRHYAHYFWETVMYGY